MGWTAQYAPAPAAACSSPFPAACAGRRVRRRRAWPPAPGGPLPFWSKQVDGLVTACSGMTGAALAGNWFVLSIYIIFTSFSHHFYGNQALPASSAPDASMSTPAAFSGFREGSTLLLPMPSIRGTSQPLLRCIAAIPWGIPTAMI